MTETRDQGAGTAAADWDCEAYGPKGVEIGALCFVAGELGERVCRGAGECAEQVGGQRRRVFRRINELAAAGDPDFEYLAEQFTSPAELLAGDGGRDPAPFDYETAAAHSECDPGCPYHVPEPWPPREAHGPALTLPEAVRKASTDRSYGVARLECGPGVVDFLRSIASDAPPAPPWQSGAYRLLPGSVPVVGDDTLPAGRWRMVDAAGGVVWEGAIEGPARRPGPAPRGSDSQEHPRG